MLAKRESQHHPTTCQPGSFTSRIRHTLKAWSNQFPFISCAVHSSWCLESSTGMQPPEDTGLDWIDVNWKWNWCQPQCVVCQFLCVCTSQSVTAAVHDCPLLALPLYNKTSEKTHLFLHIVILFQHHTTQYKAIAHTLQSGYREMSYAWCFLISSHFLFVCGGMTST